VGFPFWRRKKAPPQPVDPIAAYDGLIEDLQRQGAEVRKSAATLLALRGDLERDRDRNTRRAQDARVRCEQAAEKGDARAERVLRRDQEQSLKKVQAAEEALAEAEADAQLLLDAARDIADQVADLETERNSARARFKAGQVVSEVLRERAQKFSQVLALDAARDEVERAHQLAQIYRDERKAKG
jgi:phage shock protein A